MPSRVQRLASMERQSSTVVFFLGRCQWYRFPLRELPMSDLIERGLLFLNRLLLSQFWTVRNAWSQYHNAGRGHGPRLAGLPAPLNHTATGRGTSWRRRSVCIAGKPVRPVQPAESAGFTTTQRAKSAIRPLAADRRRRRPRQTNGVRAVCAMRGAGNQPPGMSMDSKALASLSNSAVEVRGSHWPRYTRVNPRALSRRGPNIRARGQRARNVTRALR